MNAREIALKIINEIHTNGAYANIALARELNRSTHSDYDRRFITELVYGTVKVGETLDWIINHYVSRPLNKMPPIIRDILRMGTYQIFFLSKVPVSAACNQSVELAKKYGHPGTVKFVNAVLRNMGRSPEKVVYPDLNSEPSRFISLKYFHPQWLVERWIARMGVKDTELLCQSNNTTPPLILRTNSLKITRAELYSMLEQQGAICDLSQIAPEGIICREHPAIKTLDSLQQGFFQVQDESSMLVGHVLNPKPGEFIIDACGAPGGKSTHIAALMQNQGTVISTDIHEHKLALTKQNAERLGIKIIETKIIDATTIGTLYPKHADRVLVDAPCSGLGVLRRKPDSRWRKNPKLLQDLPILQSAILHSAADCVKPGGVLVYSTCTIEPEENEVIVKNFLQSQPDFALQPIKDYLPDTHHLRVNGDMLQLLPHIDGVDGFFIARLVRKT